MCEKFDVRSHVTQELMMMLIIMMLMVTTVIVIIIMIIIITTMAILMIKVRILITGIYVFVIVYSSLVSYNT